MCPKLYWKVTAEKLERVGSEECSLFKLLFRGQIPDHGQANSATATAIAGRAGKIASGRAPAPDAFLVSLASSRVSNMVVLSYNTILLKS